LVAFCHFQIVGEIKAAREALVEVTARLRSYLYREFVQREMLPPSDSVSGPVGNGPLGTETANNRAPAYEALSEAPSAVSQSVQTVTTVQPSKVLVVWYCTVKFFSLVLSSMLLIKFTM